MHMVFCAEAAGQGQVSLVGGGGREGGKVHTKETKAQMKESKQARCGLFLSCVVVFPSLVGAGGQHPPRFVSTHTSRRPLKHFPKYHVSSPRPGLPPFSLRSLLLFVQRHKFCFWRQPTVRFSLLWLTHHPNRPLVRSNTRTLFCSFFSLLSPLRFPKVTP